MAGMPRPQRALSRFFAAGSAASTTGAFAAISADDGLLRDAQALYDQMFPASSGHNAVNTKSIEAEEEKVWALVAVVATGVARELKQEREREQQARGRGVVAADGDVEMSEPAMSAAASTSASTSTWHLVQLLAEAHVSLREFLLYFTSLFNRLLLEPELLAVTTLLKEEFTVAALLFEKYRVLWDKLVPPLTTVQNNQSHMKEDTSQPADPEPESAMEDDVIKTDAKLNDVTNQRQRLLSDFGWLLFLLAKRRLSTHYTGLGQLYNLLLSVLHLVISNLRASQPSVEAEVAAALSAMGALNSSTPASVTSSQQLGGQEILEALCAAPKVDLDDVTRASGHLALVLQQLKDSKTLRMTSTDSSTALETAIFADEVLAANVERLSALYRRDYLDGCGKLDERFVLDTSTQRAIMGGTPAPDAGKGSDGDASNPGASSGSKPSVTSSNRAGNALLSPVRRNMLNRRRENGATPSSMRSAMTPPRHQQLTSLSTQGRGVNSPLVQSWQLQGSASGSTGAARFLSFGASPRPSPGSMQTPVTAAVETSSWVRETLVSTALTPVTPQLRQFFTDCTDDPTERIARVLRERSQLLMTARTRGRVTPSVVQSTLAVDPSDENVGGRNRTYLSEVDGSLKRTKELAIVLFYRVLEPLLRSESERLRTRDFSKLLNNEVFLAALFACSTEVMLKAHSLITLSFPFLLEHLCVNAFHFVNTIESFVKHAPKLPVALKQHLGDVQNSILDSLAWRSDSGLYVLLAVDPKQPSTPASTPAASTPGFEPSPSGRVISDVARLDSNGGDSNGNGVKPSTTSSGRATVLRMFFRKVLSRAASRIYRLGSLLGLDSTDLNQVWTAVKECVTSHHYLLRDRHLDLLVLCSIYAVCKVARGPKTSAAASSMSFKRLIACYTQLLRQAAGGGASGGGAPFSTRNNDGVTRNIKLDTEHSRGDIIKFYNRCYIPAMKSFVLQFQLQESQMAAADAVVVSASSASATQSPLPGFTARKEGSNGAVGLPTSASDADSIAQAASEAVEKLLGAQNGSANSDNNGKTSVLPHTPPRGTRRRGVLASPFGSPAVSALQMFTSAEVQTLPVSMHQTSPKRVRSSNVFMSPLQQVRLDRRSQLTPRSHALYAFGESPARDLALINRAVNTAPASSIRRSGPTLPLPDSDNEQECVPSTSTSPGVGSHVRKRRRTAPSS